MAPKTLPLREELRGQKSYGAPQIDVPVKLNTNENPFAPSTDVVASIVARVTEAATALNRYPDRTVTALRGALSEYISAATSTPVGPESVWPANGSNEVLQQLLQAFGGSGHTALGFEPTFPMHSLVCRGTGTRYEPRQRAEDFSIDRASALEAVRDIRPDVVFVCSPNNPTGTAVAHTSIAAIAEAAPGIVIVDEAYGEFSTEPSAVQLLSQHPNLVVVRTMSKAFALAGARVGYLVASREVVDALQLVRLPYHLSSITQATALAALEHVDELLGYVEVLKGQRDRMAAELQAMGLKVLPSDANFVWFGGFDDAHSAWQALVDQGVLVRDLSIPGYLRASAGTPEQTDAFITAVRHIIKEKVA